MLKNIIATTALLAASAALASAVTVTFNSDNTVADATNYAAQGASAGTYTVATGTLTGGESVTVTLTESAGYIYALDASSISLDANTNATAALSALGISTSGLDYGIQGGQGQNVLTVSISGLTSGTTYTLVAIIGDNAADDSDGTTYTLTAGTLVSSTYYDMTDEDGEGVALEVATLTVDDDNAVLIVSEVTADEDGTITYTLSSKGTLFLTAIASVPEPSAFGMLAGVGALALVAARRRRSRKAA